MFSVTGVDGELYRGSLEHLPKVDRLPRPRRVREAGRKTDAPTTMPDYPDTERYRAAATAYTRTLHPQPDRGPIHHAYQIMSRDVVTLSRDASVETAWNELTRRRIGQAPVVDRVRRLVGLVSRERLLHVLNEEHGRLRDVLPRSVDDVMTTPVVTADPVTDVRRIVRVMLDYELPALPVLDESGDLVGIVSRRDVLRVVVANPPLTLWA